jgi:hypothetical protein
MATVPSPHGLGYVLSHLWRSDAIPVDCESSPGNSWLVIGNSWLAVSDL